MLTLHHLNKSRSQRILWLFEELGIDYEIEHYERDPKTSLAPKALRDIHPLGKSPVVTDGDRVLAESAHIIETILDEHGAGGLRPERGTDEYLRYRYWMHYAEGSAMGPLLLKVVFVRMVDAVPLLAKPIVGGVSKAVQKSYIDGQIHLHVKYWESELQQSEWFVGEEFTAADIQMSFALLGARSSIDLAKYPAVTACLDRIESREAYKKAIEIGGPVTF